MNAELHTTALCLSLHLWSHLLRLAANCTHTMLMFTTALPSPDLPLRVTLGEAIVSARLWEYSLLPERTRLLCSYLLPAELMAKKWMSSGTFCL